MDLTPSLRCPMGGQPCQVCRLLEGDKSVFMWSFVSQYAPAHRAPSPPGQPRAAQDSPGLGKHALAEALRSGSTFSPSEYLSGNTFLDLL